MARRNKSLQDIGAQLSRIYNTGADLMIMDRGRYKSGKVSYDDYNKRLRDIEERSRRARTIALDYRDNIMNKTVSTAQKVSYSAQSGLSG